MATKNKAKFSKSNVKELVIYQLYFDKNLRDAVSLFAQKKGERADLDQTFGGRGAEVLLALDNYLDDCATAKVDGQKTVQDAIKEEVYDKMEPDVYEKYVKFGPEDELTEKWGEVEDAVLKNPNTDWAVVAQAYEDRFENRTDVMQMLDFIYTSNLKTESKRILANAKQVIQKGEASNAKVFAANMQNEARLANEKAKKSKRWAIAGLTTAGASLAGLAVAVGLLLGANSEIKELKAQGIDTKNQAFVQYYTNEFQELNDFTTLFNELKTDGLTTEEMAELQNQIKGYGATDKAEFGHSTTAEMQLMVDNEWNKSKINLLEKDLLEAEKKLEELKNNPAATPFDYAVVLRDIVSLSEKLASSLTDNSLSADEKSAIQADIGKLSVYQDDLAKELGSKFGASIQNVMTSYEYQVASVQGSVKDLKDRIGELEAAVSKQTTQISGLESSIDRLRKEVSNLEGTIEELEAALGSSNVDQSLVEALAKANKDLEQARKDIAALEKKNTDLESENAGLTSSNTTLKNENASLKTENEKLEASNSDLASEIDALNSTVGGLNTDIANLNNEIETYKKQNGELVVERDQAVALNAEYATQIKAANDKYDALLKDYNAKVADYNKLVGDYEALDKKYQDALKANDQTALNELKAQLAQKNTQIADLNKELSAAESALTSAEGKLAEAEQKITELSNQLANGDTGYLKDLYEGITGKSAASMSAADLMAYFSDMFDIEFDNNGSAMGDAGHAPQP